MVSNDGRAPERERDGQGMPDRTDPIPVGGTTMLDRAIRETAMFFRYVEPRDPTVVLMPAWHHPGFIVLFRADDGHVYAGRVPETCPVDAMAHVRRAFRTMPSTRVLERPRRVRPDRVKPTAED